jgi:hypothetical protein
MVSSFPWIASGTHGASGSSTIQTASIHAQRAHDLRQKLDQEQEEHGRQQRQCDLDLGRERAEAAAGATTVDALGLMGVARSLLLPLCQVLEVAIKVELEESAPSANSVRHKGWPRCYRAQARWAKGARRPLLLKRPTLRAPIVAINAMSKPSAQRIASV